MCILSDRSVICIDSDAEESVPQADCLPPAYTSGDEGVAKCSSNKGKKCRMPTPGSDLEDIAANQMSEFLLQTFIHILY